MKRVGITVDGTDLSEALAPALCALNAEVFVATHDGGRPQPDPLLAQLLAALGDPGATSAAHVRAARVLRAHWLRGGELFVTRDVSAFGPDGSRRRKALEELVGTPILSAQQFREWAGAGTRAYAA
jgi:hypothetical protein